MDALKRSDSTIWAWGRNTSGQLGDGVGGTNVHVPIAVTLPLPAGVTLLDLAAGEVFSAALASDGSVWTWGSDFHGVLGDGLPIATRLFGDVVPGLDLN